MLHDPVDIVKTLANTIATHSSLANCSDLFLSLKTRVEKNKINFNSVNEEAYNSWFSVRELDSAISEARNTSPGPDDIPYQLLKEIVLYCIVLYNILVPWCREIRGEPSTDYSSGQPQELHPWVEDTETLAKVPMP